MNVEAVADAVVNKAVPPVEFAYQRNVPVTPPEDAAKLTVPGLHDDAGVTVMVASVDTVATICKRGVVSEQAGLVLVKVTKYGVVLEMLGVVKLDVVPTVLVYNADPPDSAAYHLKTPLTVDVAPKVMTPVPHLLAFIAVNDDDTTWAVTITLGLIQIPLANST